MTSVIVIVRYLPIPAVRHAAQNAFLGALDFHPARGERLDDEVIANSQGGSATDEVLESTDILQYTVTNGAVENPSRLILAKKNQVIDISTYQDFQSPTLSKADPNSCRSPYDYSSQSSPIGELLLAAQSTSRTRAVQGQASTFHLEPSIDGNQEPLGSITRDTWRSLTTAPDSGDPIPIKMTVDLDPAFKLAMKNCRHFEIFILLAIKRPVVTTMVRQKL